MVAGRQIKGLAEHVFGVKIHFLTRTQYILNIFFDLSELGSFRDHKMSFPGSSQSWMIP